jgi:hypothetical protein
MAWEWVAPTAAALTGATGVFFTWLTGMQGRAQLDRQSRRTERSAERSRLLKEQRDAYLSVLYYAELEVRRARYEREGKPEKLREIIATWREASDTEDRMSGFYQAFVEQARKELGPDQPSLPPRSVDWCSASIWSAPDGNCLLTLRPPSVQTEPERSRRIVRRPTG